MNIRFGENYWGCRRRDNASEIITVNKYFTWAGRDWRIPAVYVCDEGIVVDYCVRIITERENPFRLEFRDCAFINGRKAPESSGCGTSWYPETLRDEAHPEAAAGVEEELMEVYQCDRESGWKFWRTSFRWPEGVKTLDTLEIELKKDPISVSGPHFTIGPDAECSSVNFVHPATGTAHVLTIHGWEHGELPEHVIEAISSGRMKILKSPSKYVTLEYSVEPEIPQGELQIQDCIPSDPPVMEKMSAAGNVSIIGGADGPTSIFVAGKSADLKAGRRWATSSLHYEKAECVEWHMTFQIKDEQAITVNII